MLEDILQGHNKHIISNLAGFRFHQQNDTI